MKNRKIMIIAVIIIAIVFILSGVLFLLYTNGIINFNNPEKYKIRGVDVSSYQGNIDWDILSENIDFAYIKATEGSSFVDPEFEKNFENAQKTEIRIGAYHFFSFDSGGDTQADNFIKNVPKTDNMLPPAVDVEFYADKEFAPPEREDVQRELTVFIDRLTQYYGISPVIYSTRRAYDRYISGSYKNCDIWIRDIFTEPVLSDRERWVFWQYSEKGIMQCYDGEERFIDMNVFYGTEEQFRNYP